MQVMTIEFEEGSARLEMEILLQDSDTIATDTICVLELGIQNLTAVKEAIQSSLFTNDVTGSIADSESVHLGSSPSS